MTYTVISEGAPAPASGYAVVDEGVQAPHDPQSVYSALSIAKEIARQAGLTGRYAVEGILGLPELMGTSVGKLMHYASFFNLPNPQPGAVSRLLTQFGLPEPQTTGERLVGDVSRGVASAGTGVGAANALTSDVPAVNAIVQGLRTAPAAQAASAAGGAAASGGMREAGAPAWAQFMAALAGGIAAPTGGNLALELAKGGGRFAQAVAQPFTQAGRQQMTGAALQRFSHDPNAVRAALANQPDELIPGSLPTTAQTTKDIGLFQLERGLRNAGPEFAAQDTANNAARLAALRPIAGTPKELEAAIKDRADNAQQDYGFAYDNPVEASARTTRQLKPLLDTPAMQAAWKQAETIAANNRMSPRDMNLENPEFMHYIKLALDDQLGGAPTTSFGRNAMGSVVGVKNAFLDALDNIAPAYGIARGNYAEASGPINRMQTLQEIMQRASSSSPDVLGNPVLLPASWNRAIAQRAEDLGDVLTPSQKSVVSNVGADLDRSALSANAGKAVGSNTVQNLASDNAIAAAVGPGLAQNPVAQILAFPIRKLFDISGSNAMVKEMLQNAMQDPDLARAYMAAVKLGADPSLGQLFAIRQNAIVQGAMLGGATTAGNGAL